MTNRVTELESTVAHLQAAVDGLRAELVDANERIRLLEQHHGSAEHSNGAREQDATPFALLDAAESSQPTDTESQQESDDPQDEPVNVDDIIVA